MSWLKNFILTLSSIGASIRTKRTSKYSLMPRNSNQVRQGRSARVRFRGCWCISGGDPGDRKSMRRNLSLVNAERPVTITSGEMEPVLGGILSSRSETRSTVDRRSFGNAGKIIPSNQTLCRHGANPQENVSGRTGAISSSDESSRVVSDGYGPCIAVEKMSRRDCERWES